MYSTFTFADVKLVKASSAKADGANPVATAAFPAETLRPFKFKAVTL